MMKLKHLLLYIGCALLAASCTDRPTNPINAETLPQIFPDYVDVTIPADIAPMNFNIAGDNFEKMDVTVTGSKGGELYVNGGYAHFDEDKWHELTKKNKGGKLVFTVCVKRKGQWTRYRSFDIYISPNDLGEWGLTYRKIAPGYEVYSRMGIYQRNLSNFEETPILENTAVPGSCMNCHTANRTNPQQFTFHVRGSHGATLVSINGQREWLKARNEEVGGSMVYPYWHPSGRYCAYSTNKTHQSFHVVRSERIEVFDQASDVFVYEPLTHRVIKSPLVMTKDHFETYPVFSADGRWLYFCSSKAQPIPSGYKNIRYNLCRIAFDPSTGSFGNKVDTVFNAAAMGKSLTFPRPSYDGKYLLFTMAGYGCFPIWHKEADLWMMNLNNGKAWRLNEADSPNTDSFHNWSTNSRWIVFSSRRGNGLYTRLYIAAINDKGRATKPFLLPQENPWEYYDECTYSYNVPDFTLTPVKFDARAAGREIASDVRK